MTKTPFYLKKIKKDSKYIKDAKKLFKKAGVKYRIHWQSRKNIDASFIVNLNRIDIYAKNLSIIEFLTSVFHELGHFYSYKNNKYEYYYSEKLRRTKKQIRHYKAIALKAEKYCDMIGYGLMKTYYPNIPYMAVYYNKDVVADWKKTVLQKDLEQI